MLTNLAEAHFAVDTETGDVRTASSPSAGGCVCPGCGSKLLVSQRSDNQTGPQVVFSHSAGSDPTTRCTRATLAVVVAAAMASVRNILLPTEATVEPAGLFAELPRPVKTPVAKSIDRNHRCWLSMTEGRELLVGIGPWNPQSGEPWPSIELDLSWLQARHELEAIKSRLTTDPDCWRWVPERPVDADADATEQVEERTPEVSGDIPGAVRPVREWTERVVYKDGVVLLFHRKRWPNGVMTESREQVRGRTGVGEN